jgi:hypothetical protein
MFIFIICSETLDNIGYSGFLPKRGGGQQNRREENRGQKVGKEGGGRMGAGGGRQRGGKWGRRNLQYGRKRTPQNKM